MKENRSSSVLDVKIARVLKRLETTFWSYEGYQGYRISITYHDNGSYVIEEGSFYDLHERVLSRHEFVEYLKGNPKHKIFDCAE